MKIISKFITKPAITVSRFRGSQGDTIVEVLISIVIISLVLGGAFSLANRSNKSSIGSRERVEALKLVEGQLEILKTKRSSLTFDSDYRISTSYCFDSVGTQVFPPPASACTVGDAGYRLSIVYTNSGSVTTSYFTISATWDNLNSNNPNVSSLVYRP